LSVPLVAADNHADRVGIALRNVTQRDVISSTLGDFPEFVLRTIGTGDARAVLSSDRNNSTSAHFIGDNSAARGQDQRGRTDKIHAQGDHVSSPNCQNELKAGRMARANLSADQICVRASGDALVPDTNVATAMSSCVMGSNFLRGLPHTWSACSFAGL